jgi:hypothetical protein
MIQCQRRYIPNEGAVDKYSRLIFAVVFVGLAVFRLIRLSRPIAHRVSTNKDSSRPAGSPFSR